MRHCLQMIILFLVTILMPLSLPALQHNTDTGTVEIISETTQNISMTFRSATAELPQNLTAENLPVISKYVVIPPRAAVRLEYQSNEMSVGKSLLPAHAVEIRDPIIMRGIRMVQVIVHPVQYDTQSREFVQHESVDVNLLFTDDEPVNPVIYTGIRRNQSREFFMMWDALNLNVINLQRDNGEIGRDYKNHYLIVAREECLPYAIRLIDWKRRSGSKVDIIQLDSDEARDVNAIQESIQNLYNDYLEQGIDPFESILILGDRRSNGNMEQWNIASHRGQQSQDADYHADYIFGCLEGDDLFPEAAVGRFVSGNEDLMQLAVARTLAYEMTPDMNNREWFERAGVFTQRWVEFNESITYTARWGEQALLQRGFSEIRVQEADGQDDDDGNIIGPVLAEWFNDGMSIMAGRAKVDPYWRRVFQGVDNNTVFPIYISTCAHGEHTLNRMFRTGDDENLKGPVAAIASWGDLTTLPNNTFWLGIVSGLTVYDLSLGWSKVYAGFLFSQIFPDNEEGMGMYQTETDLLGDPGIRPWVGIPTIVETDCPESISPGSDHVEITVYEENSDNVISGAQVTLYYPGNLPDDADYHRWQPEFMATAQTDISGKVRLPFDPSIDAGTAYLTVTGRDIYPLQRELEIALEATFVSLESYEIDDSDGGNGDGNVNPGETITLSLTASNYGSSTTVEDLQARIRTSSPYLTIERPDTVVFGNIAAGDSADGNREILFTVSSDCPNGAKPEIHVDFTSTNFIWRSLIIPEVIGFDLEVNAIADGIIVGSEERNLEIEIINNGRIASPAMTVRLVSHNQSILVLNGLGEYPDVEVDETAEINGDAFRVSMRELAIPGNMAPMQLVFYLEEQAVDTARFMLQIQEQETGPMGPDDYGYYCYDNTDSDWPLAPRYSWIELSPPACPDLEGIEVDFGENQYSNAAAVIDMPFTLRFYGREYDQITIGINGFIGVGDQRRIVNFQNFRMDNAIGGPMGMIAPLWTSLTISGLYDPGVYWCYDNYDHSLIIEWYNVHFVGDRENITLNFEIMIFDSEFNPTATGDADIKFQYNTVQNFVGSGNDMPYVSVGISSPDGKTGINYSFRNQQPPGAAPLERRSAILFTTNPSFARGITSGVVYDAETEETVEGVTVKGYSMLDIAATGKSNDEGEFEMGGVFGLSDLSFKGIMTGYRGTRFELDLDTLEENGDSLLVDIFLLKPNIRLNVEEITESLARDHKTRHYVKLTNTGPGELDFTISLNEPADWLNIEPRSGFLKSREFVNLALTYDTRGLEDGNYARTILIEDAFAQVSIELPLHLNVAENNDINDSPEVPLEWLLSQNYPNPFNSSTVINYSIKDAGLVELTVYDLLGRSVVRLVNEQQEVGKYSLIIDSSMLPAGLYIYRIKSGSFTSTHKMINMK